MSVINYTVELVTLGLVLYLVILQRRLHVPINLHVPQSLELVSHESTPVGNYEADVELMDEKEMAVEHRLHIKSRRHPAMIRFGDGEYHHTRTKDEGVHIYRRMGTITRG